MPLYPTIPYVCEYCGSNFLVTVSAANVGRVRFCSSACRAKGIHPPLAERFWAKVKKTDTCWLWTGTKFSDGYGSIKVDGVPRRAPRIAWELTYGAIPDGLVVCHQCDTPLCVRPDHLFLGTRTDNMADKVGKGRQMQGEDYPTTSLTNADVCAIRKAYAAGGVSQRLLAQQYKVGESTIEHIVLRHTWRHVE